ncbi:hypothetical protein [Cohnella lupini]|uniref:hypothetical protein n=1 Tax=Cohnella lupini TaxID=1294267 RepID=UPI0011C07525|nr:hypothetical protein [Cohnella lupini]
MGLHFTATNAIPGDVKLVRSQDIGNYGKAVLFEDKTHDSFGVAKVEKKFGFLYRYDGGTYGYWVEEDKPFQATGIGDNNDFLVAVKTDKNSDIKFIALGNHMEGITPSDTYKLSLDDVKANRDEYHLKEVTDNYVLFVLNEYTEDSWTIRAFNKEGKLIADKLFGGEARYIDWD